jgi:hypothetical protein
MEFNISITNLGIRDSVCEISWISGMLPEGLSPREFNDSTGYPKMQIKNLVESFGAVYTPNSK